jgi:hypothetical protein
MDRGPIPLNLHDAKVPIVGAVTAVESTYVRERRIPASR